MKRKPFVIQGLCLGMILFGMHSCFYHVFLHTTSLPKFMVALFLAAVWFTMLSVAPFQGLEQRVKKKMKFSLVKHPVADVLILLTLALLAVYLLKHTARIQQDAKLLSDSIIYRYDSYYGDVKGRFHPDSYSTNGSRLLFSVELLLTLFMAKEFSCRNGMFLGTLPIAVLISGCLLLGNAPTMQDMVCMVCGVLGMQMVTDGIRLGGRKGFRQRTTGERQYRKRYSVAAVLLALVFGASCALSVATADTYMQGEEALLEMQHKMERRVVDASVRAIQKIMMMLGVEQPGVMNNVAPSFTGDTVLTITSDQKPEMDLYLRGFIGTRYEDGRWNNPTAEELQSLNRYLLMTQDYEAIRSDTSSVMKKEYMEDSDTEMVHLVQQPNNLMMHMKITYAKGNRSRFGYLPYYSRLSDDSTSSFLLDGDYGLRRDPSVTEYMVDTVYMDSQVENNFLSGVTLLREDSEEPDLPKNQIPEKDIRAYWDYILKNDTWLPEKGLEKTKELAQKLLEENEISLTEEGYDPVSDGYYFSETGDAYANIIISQLRHFFWTTTSYSQRLKMRASRQDYVENFLFQQKKGYCEHYATAGAVLFRAMGIPARYVSGYKVAAQDFKENEDGTYTAEVIDSRAHAWTEIYTYEGGWTVADMTPPDNRQEVNPSRDANDILSHTERPYDDDDDFLDDDDSSEKMSPEEEEEAATPTPEITDMPGDQGSDQEAENPEPESDMVSPELGGTSAGEDSGIRVILMWAGMALLLCAVLVLFWNLQAWLRHRRLKRCKSHRRYILEMNCLLERYLRCCGYRGITKLTDKEYMELLGSLYPAGRDKGMLQKYYTLLEQSRFAQDAGSPEEVHWCKRVLYSLGRHAIEKRSGARRFYVRWIRNWRK